MKIKGPQLGHVASLSCFIACPTNFFFFSSKIVLLGINVGVRISLLLNLILFNPLSFLLLVVLYNKTRQETTPYCAHCFVRCAFSRKSSGGGGGCYSFHFTYEETESPGGYTAPCSYTALRSGERIQTHCFPKLRFLLLLQRLANEDSCFCKVLLGRSHVQSFTYHLWMFSC